MQKLLFYVQKGKKEYQNASKRKQKLIKGIGVIFIAIFLFLILDILFPLPTEKYYSQVIRDKDNNLLCAYLTPDDKWRLKTSLTEINPDMIKAILTKEDKYFYYHYGVNPVAVGRALISNVFHVKRTSGASTITMQLARMASPKSRTYSNKLKEMFRAVQYEWHYSKQEILEMYLSYLPYGGNIEGVHSAAYIFFNKSPKLLSLSQAILLAVIPNRPNSLRLDKKVTEPREMRNKWIQTFIKEAIFDKKSLQAALEEPIGTNRFTIEPKTPHLCNYLHERYEEHELKTTLDLQRQKNIEVLLKAYINRVKPYGVSNGAVCVIDNETHSLVAYCGSADFYDKTSKGEVNGVNALRSPGSALKPAIYALGFDAGIITPLSKLPDVPSNFNGYSPDNFDLKFRGMVSVNYALTNSLNLPPVWLTRQFGVDKLLNLLEAANFKDIKARKNKLGISVALGGCGVTLEEITRFYAAFANEGKLYPLHYFQKELNKTEEGKPLFSKEAAFLIAEILNDIERPDLPSSFLLASKLPKVAWKTGTSYGKRDAWSIGFSPKYTVGIWMGNFDGKGSTELTGAAIATPFLLEVFNTIDYNANQAWFQQPSAVRKRKVCAETAMLPSKYNCEHLVEDYFIANVSSLDICNLYKEITVSEDEQVQYCPLCTPQFGTKQKAYPMYDVEVALWMIQNHHEFSRPPKHNPNCTAHHTGEGPRMLSPANNYEYFIEKQNPQEILLQAASDASVSKHHWYINDQFYKTANPDEKLFYLPTQGKLRVACIDDKGRKTEVVVSVKYY